VLRVCSIDEQFFTWSATMCDPNVR
jgi:hypothetical protein